jgi:NAD(P)-dependent dehydrogenase (short-subunit alcohol dehydrogenase family)
MSGRGRPERVVSVVTGAGRGVGRHIAMALAARGDVVALVARSADQLAEVSRAIGQLGGNALALPADIAEPAAVADLAARVERELGVASVLVNAAGVFGPIALVKDGDPGAWLDTLRVNVHGPYLACRAFLPGMLAQGWGRIVNVSSAAALHPPGPLNSAYGTSKVALNHFTRHLAAEVAGTGVTANVIHPGEVRTEMWADVRDQAARLGPEAEGYRKWVAWVDETGGDDPARAAELVARLTGPDAAATNGQFCWIDGGLQAPLPSWPPPGAAPTGPAAATAR